MKPKILTRLTNIMAKLVGSSDYDPSVKPITPLEFYADQLPVLPQPGNSNVGKVVTAKSGGYELKNMLDQIAVHYTEDSGKTETQKAQARANIGINLDDYLMKPTQVIDLSSTSVTLANAVDNTIYEYGELTDLTVSTITTTGEFSITFTSGSIATVLTVPNTMIMPDNFAVEADMRYEINVKNGYALVAGWAVGV